MPLRRLGEKGKAWLAFRRRFLKHHPPNHQGFYICYLCGKWVPAKEITLDHIKSRSRHPELVFSEDNIRFACFKCNAEKGSKDYDPA